MTTTVGSFDVSPGMSDRDRLLRAIRLAIAAGEQGQRLPATGQNVPDTALSRSTGEAVDAARCSSVGERPGP